MAGPWEQYAKPAEAGPWQAYSNTSPKQQENENSYLEEVMGGFASAPINAYLGLKQLTTGLTPEEEKIVEYNREAEREAPVSSILSNVATMAIPGGALIKGAQGAGRASQAVNAAGRALATPQTALQSAAGGAAYMGAQPVLNDESRLANVGMGAAGGAAGYGLGNVVGRGLTAAKSALIDPFTKSGTEQIAGRAMARAAGGNAADIAARLRSSQPIVAGTQPTVAEVADSGGLAALQRAAKSVDPEQFAAREAENTAARVAALRGIAEGGDVEAMKAARKSATEQLYESAADKMIPLDEAGQQMLNRPSIKSALMKARRLAADEGVDVAFDPENPQITGRLLSYTKQALDDQIGRAQGNKKRILQQNKEALMGFAEENLPEFAQATKTFREKSIPINQQQVAEALVEKATAPLSEYGATAGMRANSLAQALRNSPNLVRQATGMRQPIENVLSQEQMGTVRNVLQDLSRASNAQNLGRGAGSDTAQKLSMINLMDSAGAGRASAPISQALGKLPLVGSAYDQADEAARRIIADAMLDPQRAAQLMQGVSDPAALAQVLRQIGATSAVGTAGALQ